MKYSDETFETGITTLESKGAKKKDDSLLSILALKVNEEDNPTFGANDRVRRTLYIYPATGLTWEMVKSASKIIADGKKYSLWAQFMGTEDKMNCHIFSENLFEKLEAFGVSSMHIEESFSWFDTERANGIRI